MKKTISTLAVIVASTLASSAALADGFVCETAQGDLTVKIYNNTQPSAGTRTGAVMVLSDPSVQDGRKTIARFTDVSGNLSSSELVYTANVDLRFADSRRKGEYLVGTRLGEVDTIEAAIDFTYAAPVREGDAITGSLLVIKRDGSQIARDLDCARYLKN